MRLARSLAFVLGTLAILAGCQRPVVYVPVPVPPVVPPDVPKPPDVPDVPPIPPKPPPSSVAEALDRVVVGQTLAQTSLAIGREPDAGIPASEGALETARWYVEAGGERYAVVVTLDAARVVKAKASYRVERVP